MQKTDLMSWSQLNSVKTNAISTISSNARQQWHTLPIILWQCHARNSTITTNYLKGAWILWTHSTDNGNDKRGDKTCYEQHLQRIRSDQCSHGTMSSSKMQITNVNVFCEFVIRPAVKTSCIRAQTHHLILSEISSGCCILHLGFIQ